ncbi:hypothetical protein AB0B63_18605 [Micromonospora sp. NPDC049081]|uniref:hypothetical protein n=1 Tax=Micromonospora sp. NPDC049081 TaxID=3155150 RepID=UPI003411A8A3
MADQEPLFNDADRVTIGVTLTILGSGAAALGWPLASAVIGWGVCMLITAWIRVRPRQQRSGARRG